MIQCFNPKLDYFKQDVFDSLSFSQVASVGDQFYISGIAPLKGGLNDLQIMGSTHEEQLSFILDTAKACFDECGLAVENLISWTIYVTDIEGFANVANQYLQNFLGEHRPACTLVQVAKMIHPEQLIEIAMIAKKP
jgi:2-iminobutanoate/2-iminopropanoate deaminase